MKLSHIFVLSSVLALPLIGGLAWYVISTPQAEADRPGSLSDTVATQAHPGETTASSPASETRSAAEPARGQRQSLTRAIHSDEFVPPVQAPAQTEQPARMLSSTEGISALSESVAFGQKKPAPTRNRKASKASNDSAEYEILDTSPVALPLALLDPVPSTTTTEEQAAALGQLRSNFAETVGAQKHDPQSREYRDKWVAAQPSADQQYRLWFGDQAYMAQQRAQFMDKQAAK